MPSLVTVLFLRWYINNVFIYPVCMCVLFNQVFLCLQVYVPRRYAPGNSADSALGV